MKINYFDLGLYRGEEIDMFLSSIQNLENVEYEVFGFEAHPGYAASIESKFKENPNIHIYNLAISKSAKKEKLYIDNGSGQGNSIFSTKIGVTKTYIEVDSISLTDWIKENVKDFETSVNIIRFNIEGAELYLIEDIIENNFVNHFKLYLGSTPGRDIQRVRELEYEYSRFINLLTDNNITILPFCKELRNNINLTEYITNL